MHRLTLIVLAGAGVTSAAGQTAAIVGAGYGAPAPITVAPGQVVTIFANGVASAVTSEVAASGVPLPTTLGRITVSMTQLLSPKGPIAAPILSVYPVKECPQADMAPCATLLGVTLQVPLELTVNTPGAFGLANVAQLVVSDGVRTSGAVQLDALPTMVHVLRYGDTVAPDIGSGPLVTHADGTQVSASAPASVGEELVMYVVGLGPTNPSGKTGEPAPAGATVAAPFITYDYRPNASPPTELITPDLGGHAGNYTSQYPLFTGPAPGYVGLYQINFVVPSPPGGALSPCGVEGVNSNLTVSIISGSSFDGAPICVAQPQ